MKNKNKPVRPSTRHGELNYSSLDEATILELFQLYDRLSLAEELDQVACEIRRRAERGELELFDRPPSPSAPGVPGIFKTWPFSLFWKQRPR